jgi:toxin ParE1/3/4
MSYSVVFTPEAEEQLVQLYRYIEAAASANIAEKFTSGIITYCEGLSSFPLRAVSRDDIRPGLHVTNYKGRVVIAYAVEAKLVSIVGLYYGGRDFEALLDLQSDK